MGRTLPTPRPFVWGNVAPGRPGRAQVRGFWSGRGARVPSSPVAAGDGDGETFDFVLDDDFVAAASVREPGWDERKKDQAKRQKEARKRGRKERNRHRRRRATPFLGALVLLVAASAVGFGMVGQGPLSSLDRTGAGGGGFASGTTGTTLLGDGSGTTSTTMGLQSRSYTLGVCITWDQTLDGARHETRDVSCDEPHLMEMTGDLTTEAKFDQFPTESEWDSLIDVECGPPTKKYLGASLDPRGRYYLSALRPLKEGWARGDRRLHCGIKQRGFEPVLDDEPEPEFVGRVDARAQQLLYPVGGCLSLDDRVPIACTEPHEFEFVGNVDLTGKIADVPEDASDDFFEPILDPECTKMTEAFLGRPMAEDEQLSWYGVRRSTWEIGGHLAQCAVVQLDDDGPVTRTTSLKGGAPSASTTAPTASTTAGG